MGISSSLGILVMNSVFEIENLYILQYIMKVKIFNNNNNNTHICYTPMFNELNK